MTATAKGLDAAGQISLDQLNGYEFVCVYLAPLPSQSWKVRSKTVINAYIAGGKRVVFNWESDGKPGDGASAAKQALGQLALYGIIAPVPIYFNFADMDPATVNYAQLDASIDAARGLVGFNRMGAYGGYGVIKHLFDSGRIKYGWQTYAWSHGQWDLRAQLRQTQNGATVDYDEAWALDYGQYPLVSGPTDNGLNQQKLELV